MHDHDGRDHAGSACGHGVGLEHNAVMARAERACRDRDLQFTKLRRGVLEAVAGAPRPLGAYDIAEMMSAPGRRVAAVSVYRALDFLTENGFIHKIASRNAFVSCDHDHVEGEGAVFLICRSCGGVDETSSAEVEHGLDRTLASAGFKPVSRIVEIEGECGACQGKRGEMAAS